MQTITVTLAIEHFTGKRQWVARTAEGVWHCHCGLEWGDTPEKAVYAMYHASDVISVEGNQAVIRAS